MFGYTLRGTSDLSFSFNAAYVRVVNIRWLVGLSNLSGNRIQKTSSTEHPQAPKPLINLERIPWPLLPLQEKQIEISGISWVLANQTQMPASGFQSDPVPAEDQKSYRAFRWLETLRLRVNKFEHRILINHHISAKINSFKTSIYNVGNMGKSTIFIIRISSIMNHRSSRRGNRRAFSWIKRKEQFAKFTLRRCEMPCQAAEKQQLDGFNQTQRK